MLVRETQRIIKSYRLLIHYTVLLLLLRLKGQFTNLAHPIHSTFIHRI